MAASSYDAALKRVLADEGGNDDDPRDPGGRTSRGILQREWDKWRQSHFGLPSDVWEAPDDQVHAIYRAKYWDALRCDDLPAGVDYCTFDYGVNSGIGRSAKVLQRFVDVDQDGEVGPLTVAAAARVDAHTLIAAICDERMAFLQDLNTWPTFGRGWAKRVAGVREAANAMVRAPTVDRSEPPWLTTARGYLGFHEVDGNRGIEAFIELAKTGHVGDPWCAIFANGMFESVGIIGTRSAMARSFEHHANFVQIDKPALGCVVTMWRGSPASGSGHVGFYVGEDKRGVLLLGGNQRDQVCIEPQPLNRITGYWWPKNAPAAKPAPTKPTEKPVDPTTPTPMPLPTAAPGGQSGDFISRLFEYAKQDPEALKRFVSFALFVATGKMPDAQPAAPAPAPEGKSSKPDLVVGILGLIGASLGAHTGTTPPPIGEASSLMGVLQFIVPAALSIFGLGKVPILGPLLSLIRK